MKNGREVPDYIKEEPWEKASIPEVKEWMERIGSPPENNDVMHHWGSRIEELTVVTSNGVPREGHRAGDNRVV
ncbi:MAG: hypothetical protein ACTSXJ_09815 [Candidatus Baldrarchaeia archaeon]